MTSAKHQVDIAIIGGGLAGLSLAAELSDSTLSHVNIIVLEPRESYRRDKTWSYWRQKSHDYSEFETANWPAWRINDAQKSVVIQAQNAENYCYASIASDAFYSAAMAKINASSHVKVLQGELVESLRAEAGIAIIALKSEKNILVKQAIFDSRPIQNLPKKYLTQHFFGLELVADSAVFGPNCVDLMDFQTAEHGIHFMYVLPQSSNRALVESTWICQHHHHADYSVEMNEYLAKRWPNTKFEVAYTETGHLPLMAQKAHEYWLGKVQVVAIGSAAGTARASTGYAFLETLQDTKRLAHLVKNKQNLTPFRRPKIDAWLDTQFLAFLSNNAAIAPATFVQMFSNCKPASLIRFLTGQASWRDRFLVIRSIPALPMIKQLLGLS
jgi:lycopene beta-cyclase